VNMICPDLGKEQMVMYLLSDPGEVPFADFKLRLYKNDYTPINDSETDDFTQADFGGYAEIPILRSEFGTIELIAHIAYNTRDPAPQWTMTAGVDQIIYGWYLVADFSGITVLAQRFDSPRTMSVGSIEKLDPFRVGLRSLSA